MMPPEVASPQQFAPSAQGLVCAPGPRLSLDSLTCHLAGLSAEPQADRNWQEQGKRGDTQQQGAQSHF